MIFFSIFEKKFKSKKKKILFFFGLLFPVEVVVVVVVVGVDVAVVAVGVQNLVFLGVWGWVSGSVKKSCGSVWKEP